MLPPAWFFREAIVNWQSAAMIVLVVTGAPIAWRTFRGALRGHFATDIVATLSIVTALLLRQPIAGLVIVLMQRGGEMLERYAARRATRAIRSSRMPRRTRRIDCGMVLSRTSPLRMSSRVTCWSYDRASSCRRTVLSRVEPLP